MATPLGVEPRHSPFSPAGQVERFEQMAQAINSSTGRTRRLGKTVFLTPFVVGAIAGLVPAVVAVVRWLL